VISFHGRVSSLPLRFFLAAYAYLLLSLGIGLYLTLDPSVLPPLTLSPLHAHTALLGWVTLTIMGAMYQIVPTLTGKDLYRREWAEIQFLLVNGGILGILLGFLTGRGLLLALSAGMMVLASLLFAVLLYRTMWRRMMPTLWYFAVATGFFLLSLSLALYLALRYPGAKPPGNAVLAHLHLALEGWVTLTIMGAMYQMLPMLSLKDLRGRRLVYPVLIVSVLGILGTLWGYLLPDPEIVFLSGGLFSLGAFTFLASMAFTLGREALPWGERDISVRYFSGGLFYFFLSIALGLFLALAGRFLPAASRLATLHSHLALAGFVTLVIVGAMYHLVPMLAWMERYGRKMGMEEVPAIKDLFSLPLARGLFWLLNGALLGLGAGLLLPSIPLLALSGLLYLLGAAAFSREMASIILGPQGGGGERTKRL
jgi:hypothetical protein